MPQPILNQTLGELLRTNPQAQELITKAMQITPEQLQQMVNASSENPMMNQTIGELFKNGTMQKATSQKEVNVSPEQIQQTQKPSFLQKLKNLFG